MSRKAMNMVSAAIRAKQAKMLTESDFRAMSSLSNIREISSYLRTHTKFAPALSGVNDASVHRGYLEKILRRAQHGDIEGICRFERSAGNNLYSYIVKKEETDALMDFIRRLKSGRSSEYILDLSYALDSYSKLDLVALSSVKNFEELKKYLSKTDFSMIALMLPENGEQPDIPLIETALDRELYKTVLDIIRGYGDGGAEEKLREMFLLQAELTDCAVLYRGKKYYGASEDELRPDLLGFRYLLSDRLVEAMLKSDSFLEVVRIMESSKYKRYIEKYGGFSDPEAFRKKLLYFKVLKNIHFSESPPVVMMSYYFLLENELDNLIKVIEGVRYNIDPDQIMKSVIIRKED